MPRRPPVPGRPSRAWWATAAGAVVGIVGPPLVALAQAAAPQLSADDVSTGPEQPEPSAHGGLGGPLPTMQIGAPGAWDPDQVDLDATDPKEITAGVDDPPAPVGDVASRPAPAAATTAATVTTSTTRARTAAPATTTRPTQTCVEPDPLCESETDHSSHVTPTTSTTAASTTTTTTTATETSTEPTETTDPVSDLIDDVLEAP